jgi:nucleoside-diphosphate kinase
MAAQTKKDERTLAILKPDGVKRDLIGECEKRITEAGLKITKKRTFLMNRKLAEDFRKDIKEKHPIIFEALIEYMTEGPCTVLMVKGENAIEKLREICGPTNPKEAPRGTIRGDFGNKNENMEELYKQGEVIKNIIHSSGNADEAEREIRLILGLEEKDEI